MRALSINQPYAHLILLPSTDRRHKRIENRRWNYIPDWTGDLLIHASRSETYMTHANWERYGLRMCDVAFGAIVGKVRLDGAFRVAEEPRAKFPESPRGIPNVPAEALEKWPWVKAHEHVEGPICLVLSKIQRFRHPIPWKGALGFFQVPEKALDEAELLPVE